MNQFITVTSTEYEDRKEPNVRVNLAQVQRYAAWDTGSVLVFATGGVLYVAETPDQIDALIKEVS